MKVKGFAVPMDFPVIAETVKDIYRFRQMLNHSTLEEIMEAGNSQNRQRQVVDKAKALRLLRQKYRLVTWYYRRIFRANNPCFVRSLILYEMAKQTGLDVRLVVGFQKNETIEGHGWIEIEGEPFCEAADFLSNYREIISW